MKPILLTTLLSIIAPYPATAQVLLHENFETEAAIGAAPSLPSTLRPAENTSDLFAMIVDEETNKAGSGRGLFIVDLSNQDRDAVSVEYNFVSTKAEQISAFKIDFNFAYGLTSSDQKDELIFGAGPYTKLNTLAMHSAKQRYFQVEFISSGEVKFNSTGGKDATESISKNRAHALSIYVNDYEDKTISYTHPTSGRDRMLAPNSVAFYLNGELAHETSLDTEDKTSKGTIGTSSGNFGRIGFYSSTQSANNACIIDDLKVSSLE
jgi:hypothetical protein